MITEIDSFSSCWTSTEMQWKLKQQFLIMDLVNQKKKKSRFSIVATWFTVLSSQTTELQMFIFLLHTWKKNHNQFIKMNSCLRKHCLSKYSSSDLAINLPLLIALQLIFQSLWARCLVTMIILALIFSIMQQLSCLYYLFWHVNVRI